MLDPFPHCPLSVEAREKIHTATIKILATTGMSIGSAELHAVASDKGLECDGDRIRFTEEHVAKALQQVTRSFTLQARNPAHNVDISRGTSRIGMGRSAPFIALAGGKQRMATCKDYIELIKLGQTLNTIELPGQLAFPGNMDAKKVHRFMMVNQIVHTDKPYCLIHTTDIEPLCLAFDIDLQTLAAGPDEGISWAQTTVNTHSPLALNSEQCDYLITMARAGIPISISPTPSAGSTGPCSLAGNLVINNAEILGTMVLCQLLRPGLPVLYGTFPSGNDMKSMRATFGGPEARKMEIAAASMASYYQLLTRGNICITDSQAHDFQGGAEAMSNALSALGCQTSFLPGCGISAGFAMASKEKLVLDAELIASARHFYQPIIVENLDELTEIIMSVGSKGSYIGHPHTFSSFRTELFHPEIFTRTSNERWLAQNKTVIERASAQAEKLLLGYKEPEIDQVLKKYLLKMS